MTDKETELIQALIQALDRLTAELKSRSAPVSSSPAGQAQPAPASSPPPRRFPPHQSRLLSMIISPRTLYLLRLSLIRV